MKGRTILLDTYQGREAAALMVDGRLEDLFLAAADPDAAPAVGTIYRARADRPVKGQGGMFLTTPEGQVFLRQIKGLAPGQPLLVQVTGHAEPGKAVPVTARLMFKSRYVIATPGAPGLNVSRSIRDTDQRGYLRALAEDALAEHAEDGNAPEAAQTGLILRSSCAEADEAAIAEDIIQTRQIALSVVNDPGDAPEKLLDGDSPHSLAWREWTDPAEVIDAPGAFATHGVLDALEAARAPVQPLSGGGSMIVEPTRALIAVDVNTGRDTSPAAGLKANLACARALPRILRIRGLAGQITIDFAPMPKKDRRTIESSLRAALRADGVETSMAGWTPLGHFELQRARVRSLL